MPTAPTHGPRPCGTKEKTDRKYYRLELFTFDGKPFRLWKSVYYDYGDYTFIDSTTGSAIHIAGGIVIRTEILASGV
jgi:hypothetical protein